MAKTAIDPLFGSANIEPVAAARHALAVTASANDLAQVTSSLLIAASQAGTITVLMPNDLDMNPVVLPVTVGTIVIPIQVRAIIAIGAGISVVALWS
jgi:hypothetical protein